MKGAGYLFVTGKKLVGTEWLRIRKKKNPKPKMLSEEFVSSLCGGPLSSNTSIAKDVGIYVHTLSPAYSVKSAFKKNSAAPNCVAVNDSHIFAAQHEKAALHVYSRIRGNQEAYVPFPEKIRCVALADDVLILGTAEGRIMLWEVRLITFLLFFFFFFFFFFFSPSLFLLLFSCPPPSTHQG